MENSTKQIILLLVAMEKHLNSSGSKCNVGDIIQNYISQYDADKTGMTDFALEALGGCILSTKGTKSYNEGLGSIHIFGIPIMNLASDPRNIIRPSVLPGDCWAFYGDKGTVIIQLTTKIYISKISLEHIPAALSPNGDISSAPKSFSLLGLKQLDDTHPYYFGSFTYCTSKAPLQIFEVEFPSNTACNIVEVNIKSNHGHPKYTCIYRLRIHGTLSKKQFTSTSCKDPNI